MEVDERLCHQLALVPGGGLEGDQRVDVDGANADAVGRVVVGVDGGASAKGVLGVAAVGAAVPESVLRESEGNADGGLEGGVAVARAAEAEEAAEAGAEVADEPLLGERVRGLE